MSRATAHLSDAQAQRLVDGELLPGEAPELEAHARSCAGCAALLESYRALAEALEDLPVPELPADFTAGVLAEVDGRERAAARERRTALAVCAGALAALAATLLLGGFAWAPAATRLAEQAGLWARLLHLGADVLPPVVSALRLPIAAACAALTLPILLALSRILPSPRTEATGTRLA